MRFVEELAQDVRYSIRVLRKSPGFTAVVVVTIALGIGANAAIFSLTDAVWLQSLPVRDPAHLVVFKWTARQRPAVPWFRSFTVCPGDEPGQHGCSFSYSMLRQFRSLTNVFANVIAVGGVPRLVLAGDGDAVIVRGEIVSGNYFQGLGVSAAVGRTLEPADDAPGATPVAVLGYGYWKSAFGGDPAVIGKTVRLNKVPVTIVGVIASTFSGIVPGVTRDIWLPLGLSRQLENEWFGSVVGGPPPSYESTDVWWIYIIGRLKPSVSVGQAQAAADVVFRNEVFHGAKMLSKAEDAPRIILMSAHEGIVGVRAVFSKTLTILTIAVGIILLIACANVAGLMLARAAARQKEMAVRLAMGGSRLQIVRQLLTESVMLSTAGGVMGVLFAHWSAESLGALVTRPASFPVQLDARVLAFCAVTSVLSGIMSGLAPAFRSTRVDLTLRLKEAAGDTPSWWDARSRWFSLGNALVAAQVALSCVLLVGAGLLVFTLENLESVDPGFDTRNILLFSIDPTPTGYTDTQTQRLYSELQPRLSALPGVVSVSYSWVALLGNGSETGGFQIEGAAEKSRGVAEWLPVGPRFFETLRLPLLAGRTLDPADFASVTMLEPAIINESFVRQFFGGGNPLGRRLTEIGPDGTEYQIVGLVGDAEYRSLRAGIKPTVYVPQRSGRTTFEIRAAGDPLALIPTVRRIVSELDSNLPLVGVRTQDEQIRLMLLQEHLTAQLASFFGVLALFLACIGLYGLLSYEVTRRTREIGIRIACGAQQRDVMWQVAGKGVAVTLLGAIAGTAVALGVTQYLESLLYGVRPVDPVTFGTVWILLLLVAAAACFIPAQRAMRVDPAVALRYE